MSLKTTTTPTFISSPLPAAWRSMLSLRGGGGDVVRSSNTQSVGRSFTNRSSLAYLRQTRQDDDDDNTAANAYHRGRTAGTGTGTARNLRAFSTSPSNATAAATTAATGHTTSTSSNSSSNNKTPFLTLVLLKLDGLLDEYCVLLSQPSYKNAVQASILMETCIATATTSASSPNIHQQQIRSTSTTTSLPSPSRMGTALSSLFSRSPTTNAHYHQNMDSPSNHSTGSAPGHFRHWLSPSTSSSSPSLFFSSSSSQSAMALQGEWETYQRPFLLFAAAIVLYMDMYHVHQHKNKNSIGCVADDDTLQLLFQYLGTEFQIMEQTLCGPFLDMMTTTNSSTTTTTATTTSNSNNNSGNNKYHMAAKHVAHTLRTLVAICQTRSHLISMQCNLFLPPTGFDNLENSKSALAVVCSMSSKAMQGIALIVSTRNTTTAGNSSGAGDGGGANDHQGESVKTSSAPSSAPSSSFTCPLGQVLLQELDTWKHCLNAAAGLEACQFFDAIVSLALFKQSLLPPSSSSDSSPATTITTTRLGEWFQKTYYELLSLLPIYFDRVQAFAGPLYGFEAPQGHINNYKNSITTTTTSTILSSPPPLTSSSSNKNNSHSSGTNNDEEDWNSVVGELLRRQERLGGPPTAVALVLDASSTNNLHVERGFQLSSATKSVNNNNNNNNNVPQQLPRRTGNNDNGIDADEQQAPNDATLSSHILWPAIYLRSTTHLKHVTHASNSTNFSSRTSLVSTNSVRGPAGGFLSASGFDWSSSSSSQDIINENAPINNATKYHRTTLSSSAAVHRVSNSSFAITSSTANQALSPRSMSCSHINWSVLEYEPDAGKVTSWPHTEWDSLVITSLTVRHHHSNHNLLNINNRLGPPPIPGIRTAVLVDGAAAAAVGGGGDILTTASDNVTNGILTRQTSLLRMMQEPIAVTYWEGDDDQTPHQHQQHDQSSTSLLSDGRAGLFGSTSSSDQSTLLPVVSFTGIADDNKSNKRPNASAYHVVSLSRYISLVVIVKGDNVEESRFLRRRSRIADEDIRAFLDHWAQKLRVSNRFTRSFLMALPRAKKASKDISPLEFSNPLNVTTSSTDPTSSVAWTASHVQTYFKQVKDAFGLRTTSPLHGSASRSRSFGKGHSNSSSNRGIDSSSPFGSKSSFLSLSARTLSDLHAVATELNSNIQKSVDLFFLGPELSRVIEMYD